MTLNRHLTQHDARTLKLTEFLNADKRSGRRLAALIENMQRLREIQLDHWCVFLNLRMREEVSRLSAGEKAEVAKLEQQINRELKRCNTHPEMHDILLQPIFHWAKPRGGFYTFLILQIVLLTNEGLLERFRRCRACSKWIFARKRDQNFCRAACRQRHYQSDPTVKQRRREHMKKYMRSYRRLTAHH